MTITWRTDATVTSGSVEYQPLPQRAGTGSQVPATAAHFPTDLGLTHLFTATLTGLAANTKYRYHVGEGTHWSDWHTFATADPHTRAFKFLLFGDSQCKINRAAYLPWRTTVQHAFAANPEAKFMINMGDLVDTGQSGEHWKAWFAAAAGVIDTIPEMAVLGNHETYGLPGSSKPAYWLAQFHLPRNGPAGLQGEAYSYDYGPVHFVVLDSQQDEEGDHLFARQQAWLDANLTASHAPWKIVMFHKTPYELKLARANPAVKAAFCPIMERQHVDLVFNGHDHGISRTFPIKDGTYQARPSQGTIYCVTGRSGGKTYDDLEKKPWNTYFYNPLEQPVYLVVLVADSTLTINTYQQDNTLLDTFVLDKAKDTDSDCPAHAAAPGAPTMIK